MEEDGSYVSNGSGGVVMYGPYSERMNGEWECILNYEMVEVNKDVSQIGDFSVTANTGQKVLANEKIEAGKNISIIQNVTDNAADDSNIEMKVTVSEGVKIKSIEMKRKN